MVDVDDVLLPHGWVRDKPDPRDYVIKPSKRRGIGLEDMDLRKTGFLPSVFQQYETNACTGMAISAAIEYMHKKQGIHLFEPSKLFIYWNGRVLGNCTNVDDGAGIRDSFKSLKKWGAATEEEFPFIPENLFLEPPLNVYEGAKKEIIDKYQRIASTAKDIMAVLSRGQPIVFGVEMFSNFNNERTVKTGYIEMPGGTHRGGHCMLIVGVTATHAIIRNSWGDQWGDGGYGYMPFNYIENDNLTGDFWTISEVP